MTEPIPKPQAPPTISPRARLIAGCLIATAGGVLATSAILSRWHVLFCGGRPVAVPGGGTVDVGGAANPYSGADLSGWLAPVAVLLAALPAAALLAGRRGRGVMLLVAALGALVLMVGIFGTASPRVISSVADCRDEASGGRSLAFIGAVVVVAGVGLAAKPAAVVPRLRPPERPPSEVET